MTELQKIELDMLRDVASLCDRHGLPYFALGGTLLGAVRHQGFIPWDDDIDIALLRPDYDRFVDVARRELPSHLRAVTFKDSPNERQAAFHCSVQNMRTDIVLEYSNKPRRTHVWIDVFPLDAMPTSPVLRGVQKYRLLYERMKVQFSMYDENVHQHREGRPVHERALMKFRELTKVGSNWDTYELMSHVEKTLKSFDVAREGYVVNMFGAYKFKEMFPKWWLGEGVMLPFEDTEIRCPVEYDRVLTQMYGDYMTPVPEGQRAQHHCMTVVSLGGGDAE